MASLAFCQFIQCPCLVCMAKN